MSVLRILFLKVCTVTKATLVDMVTLVPLFILFTLVKCDLFSSPSNLFSFQNSVFMIFKFSVTLVSRISVSQNFCFSGLKCQIFRFIQ